MELSQGIRFPINQDLQQYGREVIGPNYLAVSHRTHRYLHIIRTSFVVACSGAHPEFFYDSPVDGWRPDAQQFME